MRGLWFFFSGVGGCVSAPQMGEVTPVKGIILEEKQLLSCLGLLPRLGSTQVSLKRCWACFAMMLDSLGMCRGLLCLSYGGTQVASRRLKI